MASAKGDSSPAALPDGYVAIPVTVGQKAAPLRICVLVKREPDPVAGHLVVLRGMLDAQVFLGCVLDAGGHVHQWLEVWVQNLDSLVDASPVCREVLTNAVLDERWSKHAGAIEALDAGMVLQTGWETVHPAPTYLDLSELEPMHPVESDSGSLWQLCQDDEFLAKKDLPEYSSSLHRYLYLSALGEKSPLIPVTADAPSNANTKSIEEIAGGKSDLIPLNPGGGLMLVRPHHPVGFEAFVDLLSGQSWGGVMHGRSIIDPDKTAVALAAEDSSQSMQGGLFLGAHGRWGRLLETFHLKLRLLADAVTAVRHVVAHHQRPLLNLSADAFQVSFADRGHGLPFLWTATTRLVDPGDAIALSVKGSDSEYYLRPWDRGASIYQPESAGQPLRGRGAIRIRKILDEGSEATTLEGTFRTQERVSAARNDLIRFRLNLGCGRLDLYAHLDVKAAMASGEFRFRTVSQRLSQDAGAALRAAEGVPISDVTFEVIPLLSSPCDLYALGVLAVRALLVDAGTSLPMALDETLSLAQEVANKSDEESSLSSRVKAVFNQDVRWVQSLGPHRLTRENVTPGDAFDLVPSEVWWSTLAMILRMFPGVGPDSICRDFGDAQPGGIHKVFDQAIRDLDDLLIRTRSLIVIDWRFNREIHSVIRSHLTGIVRAPGARKSKGKS